MSSHRPTRREALRGLVAAGFAFPAVYRAHASGASPNETLLHASFGASGMGFSDLRSLTESKNLKLVAVAEVDLKRAEQVRKLFPGVKVYQDWRELLDKEKGLNSVNVSTPDHMHAPITMRAMGQGLHVYTQKPLTQTIFEARKLTEAAAEKKLVTQMGIQVHSHVVHRTIVEAIHEGVIGKVKEVHSWSGKHWGDAQPKPDRSDPVPADMNWDFWLGVAKERPFIQGYYHPGEWRKRLDFGTGTFGDMGCHILDPVFGALALTAPSKVRSEGGSPVGASWGLDSQVRYDFPATKFTDGPVNLTWYDGDRRPPASIKALIGERAMTDQGSIFIGTTGVLYAPYIDQPIVIQDGKATGAKLPDPGGQNHYLQFVDACRGMGKTSAPFSYSGPLTEMVLLGCLATRFPQTTLEWSAATLQVVDNAAANEHVRRKYRKGWEVPGL